MQKQMKVINESKMKNSLDGRKTTNHSDDISSILSSSMAVVTANSRFRNTVAMDSLVVHLTENPLCLEVARGKL